MDTLIIAAILGSTDAGIYAAGTRYLLIGMFTAEAIMQVLGPRISALLAVRKRVEAARLYSIATAWQTALTWSVYLIVIFFSTPLFRLFGPEYVAAGPALVWLAFAMLLSSLCGPSDTIILMSGRARLSLFNAFIAVGINVVGNFLLVPHFGITAAGADLGSHARRSRPRCRRTKPAATSVSIRGRRRCGPPWCARSSASEFPSWSPGSCSGRPQRVS